MPYFKALALSLVLSTTLAIPLASPVEDVIPDKVLLPRAATSALGTSFNTVSCPSSNGTTFRANNGVSFVIECGFDRPGQINMVYTSNFATCVDACAAYTGCVDVSYVSNGGGACYMKSSVLKPGYGSNIWGARLISVPTSTAAPITTTLTTTVTSKFTTTTTTTQSSSTISSSSTTTSTYASSTILPSATTGKRGLGYNTGAYGAYFTGSPEVTWGYDWGQSRSGLPSSFDYCPMLWDASTGSTSNWKSNAQAAINAGSKYLLGFNEPDLNTQSNMTAAVAAAAWKQWMQPFAGTGVKLVSPAVTNGGGEMGLQWMTEFLGNCTGCTVDAIALHWYSNYGPDLQNHIQQAYALFNKPIWITEIGLTGSTNAQISSFLQSVMPWMDNTTYVQRYAYFGVFSGLLLNSNANGLSDYGSVYANFVQ